MKSIVEPCEKERFSIQSMPFSDHIYFRKHFNRNSSFFRMMNENDDDTWRPYFGGLIPRDVREI